MRTIIIFLTFFSVLGAADCLGFINGSSHVTCENGDHVITVSGYSSEEQSEEFVGIVLRREAIGICQNIDFVPEIPLPFDPQPDSGSMSLKFEASLTIQPPLADVVYRYSPFGVRPDGSMEPFLHLCDSDFRSYALASCGGAPFARGRVELVFPCDRGDLCFRIELCEDDCWTESVDAYLDIATLELLAGEPPMDLLGQVVDVFGGRTYCTMPGGDYHSITRIERAPAGGCGPVPVERWNWGGVKAIFR